MKILIRKKLKTKDLIKILIKNKKTKGLMKILIKKNLKQKI